MRGAAVYGALFTGTPYPAAYQQQGQMWAPQAGQFGAAGTPGPPTSPGQPQLGQPFPAPRQAPPVRQAPRDIRNFWCPMLMGDQMSLAPEGAQKCNLPGPLQVHHWCRLANVLRMAEIVSVHALALPIYSSPDHFPLPDPPPMPNGDRPYRAQVEWLEDLLKQWEWQARKLWEAHNNMLGARPSELGEWMPYNDRSAEMQVPAPEKLAHRLRLVEVKMEGWARMAGASRSAVSGGQGLLGQQDFGQ
ncbi:hypothetical protein CMUS01_16504 [Colletotrichum musicola]|uniref:Uncharacterized protein n=1 Tax=Colletotrichum musicola TaxID=2175873 RepID=A0A8H6IMK4_9PEZI|nr:hypothetical protein CMUS01_16504 [Colletotrichum musicola]